MSRPMIPPGTVHWSRAARQHRAGNLTDEELARIDRKADKILGEA